MRNMMLCIAAYYHFCSTAPPTTEIYTLSLHDALPICYFPETALLGQSHPDRTQFSRLLDRKSTRLNSSHSSISYAVFCLKKKTIAIAALVVDKAFPQLYRPVAVLWLGLSHLLGTVVSK